MPLAEDLVALASLASLAGNARGNALSCRLADRWCEAARVAGPVAASVTYQPA
jgi:hypothetical protein